MMVAFANGPSYGGGLCIAPAADFADGELDVCFVRQTGKVRLLRLLPKVSSGRHVGLPEVEYFKAAPLRLKTEVPIDVYADGEFVCRTPVEVSVAPRALRVIAPWKTAGAKALTNQTVTKQTCDSKARAMFRVPEHRFLCF
jgi:diacylglycerol kinase (ATP)